MTKTTKYNPDMVREIKRLAAEESKTTKSALTKRITKLVDHIDGCISASAYCARDLKVHVDRKEIKAELYRFVEELTNGN